MKGEGGGGGAIGMGTYCIRPEKRAIRLACETQVKFQNANYFYANAGKVFQLAAVLAAPHSPFSSLPLPFGPTPL